VLPTPRGTIVLRAELHGFLGKEIKVDLVALGPGEVPLAGAGDPASAAAALRVDGAVVGWEPLPETHTLRSSEPLPAGAHVVRVEPGAPLDLAGKGLEQAFEQSFSIDGVQPIAAIFEVPDPRVVPLTTLGNRFTFQGRPFDAETGLFYFRNRQYDPELGRFITPDPLGNVDGPSSYAFAGYSPFDFGDPYGLRCLGIFDKDCSEYLPEFGKGQYRRERERLVAIVEDQSLSPSTRWRAAGLVNVQIPLWLLEELGRGMLNTPVSFSTNVEGAAEDYAQAANSSSGEDAFMLYSRGTGRLAFAFVEGVSGAEGARGLTVLGSRVFRRGVTVVGLPASTGCASYGCEFVDDELQMVGQAANGSGRPVRFIARADGNILDLLRVRIPGPRNATQGKIDYLLGRVASEESLGKGGFFRGVMDFTDDSLEAALRVHLSENFSAAIIQGNRIKVVGSMVSPGGRIANVRSVWQVTDDGFIDLVTAFPE
jgi:RHS repeat-associated protein